MLKREMRMKTIARDSASRAQDMRANGLTLPQRVSSFILHPSSFFLLTLAFALCLFPAVLHAQGCAMCYNSASAARSGAKEALANGTLILLVPPMVFFALIAVVVYRYRNKFREPANWRPEHDRELQELLADLDPVAVQESQERTQRGALATDRGIR